MLLLCCYVAIVEGVVDTSTIATSRQEREVAEETNAGKRYLLLRSMIQERQLVSFEIKKAVVVCGFHVFARRGCEGCITVYFLFSGPAFEALSLESIAGMLSMTVSYLQWCVSERFCL